MKVGDNPYGHDKHCPTCTCNAKANKDKLYQSIEGKDFNPETPVVTYNEGLGEKDD